METAVLTNTALVQQAYGYFSTGNIPALLEMLADDVKWLTPGPTDVISWAGARQGKAAVGRFFMTLDQEVQFDKFEVREFVEQGNKVVALGYMEGRSKRTGRISASDWAMIFTFKNGKVTNFQEYSDTNAAVKAFS